LSGCILTCIGSVLDLPRKEVKEGATRESFVQTRSLAAFVTGCSGVCPAQVLKLCFEAKHGALVRV
jgi:hypothetical protein